MFGYPLYLELCISRSASSLGTQVIGHIFFKSRFIFVQVQNLSRCVRICSEDYSRASVMVT